MLCRRKVSSKAAESQTEDMNIVPLLLAEGVPCKARILFSLWQAGHQIVRLRALLSDRSGRGAHLRRLEEASDSSS